MTIIAIPALLFGWGDWRSLETGHFQVFYKPGYDSSAALTAAILENYRPNVEALTGAAPDRTRLAIEDIGTMSNGMTDPVYGRIDLFTYPADPWSQIGYGQNWWRDVSVHEYIHMSHLTNTSGFPAALVAIFGSLMHPNLLSPNWVMEGIAVLGESRLSPWAGRLNDGFFDAYIGARASEHRFPSLMDATYVPVEYPYMTGVYIYGSEFLQFMNRESGEGALGRLFRDNGGRVTSYCNPLVPAVGFDFVAPRYFPGDIPSLYARWASDAQKRYSSWHVDGERLTRAGGTISFVTEDGGRLYYLRERTVKTGPGRTFDFADIVERDLATQKERTVVSPLVTALNPIRVRHHSLYYPSLDFAGGYANASYLGFGFVSNLHVRDLATNHDRVLLRDRMRCFGILDDGRVIYARDRNDAFGSEVFICSAIDGRRLESFTTGYEIGEIDADAGRIVVVARHDWENFNIYTLDVTTHSLTPIARVPMKESSIHLAGNRLFYTANYDRTYSSYCCDLDSGVFTRLTECGFADWPVHDAMHGDLYFSGLNSNGNDIYRKGITFADTFLTPETLKTEVPDLPDISGHDRHEGYSSVLPSLLPTIHVPFLLPLNATFRAYGVGALLMGEDITGEHTYQLQVMEPFSTTAREPFEAPTFDLTYNSLFFVPLSAALQVSNYPNLGDLALSYPLFVHPDWLLNRISLGLEAAMSGSRLSRRALIPSLAARFASPVTRVSANASLLTERRWWHSDFDAGLLDVTASVEQYTGNSELVLTAEAAAGNYPSPLVIRGFSDTLRTRAGGTATLEYMLPLLKIRRGIWNPNIYFEDLCGSVFLDVAAGSGVHPRAFLAAALEPEFGVLFLDVARLVPILGAGINSDLKPQVYAGIEITSSLLLGAKAAPHITNLITGKACTGLENHWPLSLCHFASGSGF